MGWRGWWSGRWVGHLLYGLRGVLFLVLVLLPTCIPAPALGPALGLVTGKRWRMRGVLSRRVVHEGHLYGHLFRSAISARYENRPVSVAWTLPYGTGGHTTRSRSLLPPPQPPSTSGTITRPLHRHPPHPPHPHSPSLAPPPNPPTTDAPLPSTKPGIT